MRSMIHFSCVIILAGSLPFALSTPATAGQADSCEGSRIAAIDVDTSSDIGHAGSEASAAPRSMSRTDLRGTIQVVIMSGVQLFNQGNAAATARIYNDAARMLLASPALRTDERKRLQRDLRSSLRSSSARESAWQLRHALVDVVDSLDGPDESLESARALRG